MTPDAFAFLVGGLGGLLGALVGGPLVEWLKDQLGARRAWQAQKAATIATLRGVIARCDAFFELYDEGVNTTARRPEAAAEYRAILSTFDLDSLTEDIKGLSALNLAASERSAAAQSLVQQAVVLINLMGQVKRSNASHTAATGADSRFVQRAKDQLHNLKLYIDTHYSAVVGLPRGLIYDPDLANYKLQAAFVKVAEASARKNQAAKELERIASKALRRSEPPTRADDSRADAGDGNDEEGGRAREQ